jgi:RNA polymerase sigma-70 factor (ECF subfamily)
MTEMTATLPNEPRLIVESIADPAAFAALYDHYFPRIYNYIRYRIGNADLTDDLTAQVFERALVNLGAYRSNKAPFEAWLFIIARNAVNDHLRAHQRRRWFSLDFIREWASPEPQPGEVIAGQERQEALLAAVANLGERERDLIGLKFAAGLTNRRIAELTGLSESNVGVILYRAIRQLRAQLKARGVEQ